MFLLHQFKTKYVKRTYLISVYSLKVSLCSRYIKQSIKEDTPFIDADN